MVSCGDYPELFDKFFRTGRIESTYKCVFLYALTDVARIGEQDLVGGQWISESADGIILNPDFIAIRFAKYYWEVSDLDINHSRNQATAVDRKRLAINVFATINKEKPRYTGIPSLRELAIPAMADFRNEIFKKSIKPEILIHLKTDFPDLYENLHPQPMMKLEKDVVSYLKTYRDSIRHRLRLKLKNHLKRVNPDKPSIKFAVERENPFYEYVIL